EADALDARLRFLTTLALLWLAAARHDPHAPEDRPDEERGPVLAGWLDAARGKQQQLLTLLDSLAACRVPQPSGSPGPLRVYDRRRVRKEQGLEAAINAALATSLAVGALHGAAGAAAAAPAGSEPRPPWEPHAIELEQALVRGDPDRAREVLPRFLEPF